MSDLALTPVELQIADLTAAGFSAREVAGLLAYSPVNGQRSVERHLEKRHVRAEVERLRDEGYVMPVITASLYRALSTATKASDVAALVRALGDAQRVIPQSVHQTGPPISLHVHLDGEGQIIEAWEHLGPVILHPDGTWEKGKAAPAQAPRPVPGTVGRPPSSAYAP